MVVFSKSIPIYKSNWKGHYNRRAALARSRTGKWYNLKRFVQYKPRFRLMDLPSTVTIQVWRYCLTADASIKLWSPPHPKRVKFEKDYRDGEQPHIRLLGDPVGFDVNLLLICRRVYEEGSPLIFRANTFDCGFFHTEHKYRNYYDDLYEYIPPAPGREEAERWRYNDFFSLVDLNEKPERLSASMDVQRVFIAMPADRISQLRSLSISSPTPRSSFCAAFPNLRHVTISYPRRFVYRSHSVYTRSYATSWRYFSSCPLTTPVPDEDTPTLPKYFENFDEVSGEDLFNLALIHRLDDARFYRLLDLWRQNVQEHIQLSVVFTVCEMKGRREKRFLFALEYVFDPLYHYVATYNGKRLVVQMDPAWLAPIGMWRECSQSKLTWLR